MRWKGRRQSDNIEDRRGQSGGFGGGIGRGGGRIRIRAKIEEGPKKNVLIIACC